MKASIKSAYEPNSTGIAIQSCVIFERDRSVEDELNNCSASPNTRSEPKIMQRRCETNTDALLFVVHVLFGSRIGVRPEAG